MFSRKFFNPLKPGSTLLEILISTAILSSLLVTLLLSLTHLLVRQSQTLRTTQATNEMQRTMETIYGIARTDQWNVLVPDNDPYYVSMNSDASWNISRTPPTNDPFKVNDVEVAIYVKDVYRTTNGELNHNCTSPGSQCIADDYMRKFTIMAVWENNPRQELQMTYLLMPPSTLQVLAKKLIPTPTPTPTPTPRPTNTPTPKPTNEPTPIPNPQATNTPTPKPKATSTPTPAPGCKSNGASCSSNSNCCSNYCNSSKICRNRPTPTPTKKPSSPTATPTKKPPTPTPTKVSTDGGICKCTSGTCSGILCGQTSLPSQDSCNSGYRADCNGKTCTCTAIYTTLP